MIIQLQVGFGHMAYLGDLDIVTRNLMEDLFGELA